MTIFWETVKSFFSGI
ncbi:MAG TPA: hypothetical protein DHW60_03320 [Ruminococcus sp.]|nr:hypothetical protein [Ruminococcus sp.]